MKVISSKINLSTSGYTDIIDITGQIEKSLERTKLKDGLVNVSIAGSTAAISTYPLTKKSRL
jgi:thiamine phosphate synthase YjbQ (UPF0047 family)